MINVCRTKEMKGMDMINVGSTKECRGGGMINVCGSRVRGI